MEKHNGNSKKLEMELERDTFTKKELDEIDSVPKELKSVLKEPRL